MFQAHVARRVDSRVAGSQKVVDTNSSFGVVPDASGLEIQAFDVGSPADAGRDFVDGHADFVVVADEIDNLLSALHSHGGDLGVEMYLDAITRQGVGKNLGGVALLLRQKHRV